MNEIRYTGDIININGKDHTLDYPIMDAFEIDGKIVVLFDPDSYTSKFGQFRNLIALDMDGRVMWIAELPTTSSADRYYKIASKSPLKVLSFESYECYIDDTTGHIKNKVFYK